VACRLKGARRRLAVAAVRRLKEARRRRLAVAAVRRLKEARRRLAEAAARQTKEARRLKPRPQPHSGRFSAMSSRGCSLSAPTRKI
jgi:hypothetical protein